MVFPPSVLFQVDPMVCSPTSRLSSPYRFEVSPTSSTSGAWESSPAGVSYFEWSDAVLRLPSSADILPVAEAYEYPVSEDFSYS